MQVKLFRRSGSIRKGKYFHFSELQSFTKMKECSEFEHAPDGSVADYSKLVHSDEILYWRDWMWIVQVWVAELHLFWLLWAAISLHTLKHLQINCNKRNSVAILTILSDWIYITLPTKNNNKLLLRPYAMWYRVVWYVSNNLSEGYAAWILRVRLPTTTAISPFN
jgi:hypothetical protein